MMHRDWSLSPLALRLLSLCLLVILGVSRIGADSSISFNRDIRPILSDRCFQCHGPDKSQRQAGLRLDIRENAVSALKSGEIAIVPGRPDLSLLVHRIETADLDDRMPPPDSNKALSESERALLRRWIEEGANYEGHWSFLAPIRSTLPTIKNKDWVRNPIDAFIVARLEDEDLSPQREPDRATLLRRATLVLTGLPPTPFEMKTFLEDSTNDAFERVADRLLESDRFGEHLASSWLDAARYSDTNGYNNDTPRYNWRYRDWVIQAFNRNLTYDRFLTEQLAGDLLEDPTLDQLIATGFNRNHNVTSEGGIIDEEYRLEYVADRVQTTATVFMAMTLRCARCHDHKFDPISQKEYYEFFAFFNQVPETGYHKEHVGNPNPVVSAPTDIQERRLALLKQTFDAESDETKRSVLMTQIEALEKTIPTAMVMTEMAKRRETFVLMRGDYSKPTEQVEPDVPSSFPPLSSSSRRNRLGLAAWLTEPGHPLTARVAVNRLWYLVFGRGLVTSLEDFGSQGDWPSHPLLLDWLATELVRLDWDQKALLRLMVTSATFRQHSGMSETLQQKDPQNIFLSRGPRYRLAAEVIRDGALLLGGLLQERIGGASVRPYQPPGLWTEVIVADDSYSGGKYVEDRGADLFRRSVYTWWKRTCPPPGLNTFDAPDREFCSVQRARTNTPLQALVLLNDPTYVEAARGLAARILNMNLVSDHLRVREMVLVATGRVPALIENQILLRSYSAELERFQKTPDAARGLLGIGESTAGESLPADQLAAWTIVASMILNLDEVITLH
jgi:hypothetical protein